MRNIPWSLCLFCAVAGLYLHGAKEPRTQAPRKPASRTVDGEMLVKWNDTYFFDIEKQPFTGKALSKFPNGNRSYFAELDAGKPHGRVVTYYPDGKKQFEALYKQGIQHGLETNWYTSGKRQLQINYVDGLRHGKMTSWKENGSKDMEIFFVQGKKDGPIHIFDENGELLTTRIYKNGHPAKPPLSPQPSPHEASNLLAEENFIPGEHRHPDYPVVDAEAGSATLTHVGKTNASGWIWLKEDFKPPFEISFEYLARPRLTKGRSTQGSGMAILFGKLHCPDTVPKTEGHPGFMPDGSGFSLLFPTSGNKVGFQLLDAKGDVLQKSNKEVTKSGGKWKKVGLRVQKEGVHVYFNEELVFTLADPDFSGTGARLALVASNGKIPCTHTLRNLTLRRWGEGMPPQQTPNAEPTPKAPMLDTKTPTIGFAHIISKQGLRYETGRKRPFTGKAIDFYDNGQRKLEYHYKTGRQHGLSTFWYPTGQIAVRITYVEGVPLEELKWTPDGAPIQ